MSSTVPVTVVVAFYSRCGTTETRALTAAVGSVNARALIRMRRMPDTRDATECAAETARMRKEYVPPTEVDLAGADALVVAVPPASARPLPSGRRWFRCSPRSRPRTSCVARLRPSFRAATPPPTRRFAAALGELGFTLVEPAAAAGAATPGGLAHVQAHGRLVAETSRALKSSR